MDPSKAFDTINHEVPIAKSHTYGFSIEVLEVLLSYLQEVAKSQDQCKF